MGKKVLTHDIALNESDCELNRLLYLKPSTNELTQSPDVELAMTLPDHSGVESVFCFPKDGSVLHWESVLTLIRDVPNSKGKFAPVQVSADGFIRVAQLTELMASPRTSLNVYCHGIPPYKKRNSILFVPDLKREQLFVLYAHCQNRNASLIHKAAFYEQNNKTYLHCNMCHQTRFKMVKPLESTIEWRVDDEGYVEIKLDAAVLRNPTTFTDTFGHCPLETLISFFCTNSFRLSHPKRPEGVQDVFVLGELEFFNDWKDEHSPSITTVASAPSSKSPEKLASEAC